MYECNLLNIRILCLLQGLNQQIAAAGTIMIFAADQADIPRQFRFGKRNRRQFLRLVGVQIISSPNSKPLIVLD